MGRLDGLSGYLAKYEGDDVILTFDEIEALMGSRLPRSARKVDSPFWSGHAGNVYARGWTEAGYVTSFDECEPNEVRFTRHDPPSNEVGAAPPTEGDLARLPPPPGAESAGASTRPAGTGADAAAAGDREGRGPEGTHDEDAARSALPPPPVALEALPPPPISPAERAASIATQLVTAFTDRQLTPSKRGAVSVGWDALPDVQLASLLKARDADPVWIRILQTFGVLLDRGRGDPTRWSAVLAAFDAEPSLFEPETVASRTLGDLASELHEAGLTRKLTEVTAWRLLGEALAYSVSAPMLHHAVFDGTGDATGLVHELTGETPSGHSPVPGLSTNRVVVRWIRMLVYPGEATIDGLDQLRVVVDADVRRATEFLGVTETGSLPLSSARSVIEERWAEATAIAPAVGPAELAGTALSLDQALAFHGRVGCLWCKTKLTIEPMAPACDGCRLRG